MLCVDFVCAVSIKEISSRFQRASSVLPSVLFLSMLHNEEMKGRHKITKDIS